MLYSPNQLNKQQFFLTCYESRLSCNTQNIGSIELQAFPPSYKMCNCFEPQEKPLLLLFHSFVPQYSYLFDCSPMMLLIFPSLFLHFQKQFLPLLSLLFHFSYAYESVTTLNLWKLLVPAFFLGDLFPLSFQVGATRIINSIIT